MGKCGCKSVEKRCKSCTKVRHCSKHHHKKCAKLRPCEYIVTDSYANIPGYKYDYICPALTTSAGGSHYQ